MTGSRPATIADPEAICATIIHSKQYLTLYIASLSAIGLFEESKALLWMNKGDEYDPQVAPRTSAVLPLCVGVLLSVYTSCWQTFNTKYSNWARWCERLL